MMGINGSPHYHISGNRTFAGNGISKDQQEGLPRLARRLAIIPRFWNRLITFHHFSDGRIVPAFRALRDGEACRSSPVRDAVCGRPPAPANSNACFARAGDGEAA